ncbi:bifunctional metallophosphatase/5'-nucleotidase [Neisseriaceae bacterium JH1-16]|nr:bifunctional metallophosphatase/5'-nucleotidase [Neisseriaceae bacterium JH1-16]
MSFRPLLIALAISAVLAGCQNGSSTGTSADKSATADVGSTPVPVRLIAINDFHGNLEAPTATVNIPDPSDRSKTLKLTAGGADTLAAWIKQRRALVTNSVVVSAGDLIGASPLISSLFHDEPTIEAMNKLGLDINAVGNHEFDDGQDELLRMQNGGCKTGSTTSCQNGGKFDGAKFKFLAANVEKTDGSTLFPAYEIKRFGGVPVAFIGMTLKGTPDIVTAAGVQGLSFKDEVATVNKLVPVLKKQGVNAIVVVVHEGGLQTGNYNDCDGISGAIVDIVKGFDKAVGLVVSGHTHRAYNCVIDGRRVTSAYNYGQMFTEIDFNLDPKSGTIVPATLKATNRVATRDITPDSTVTQLVDLYKTLVSPLANRVAGYAAGDLLKSQNAAGESTQGDVIADAQLAATVGQGAQLALMNPGGIRADIKPSINDGSVTYNQLFTTQPFNNLLVTLTLSGTELAQLLEQQWTATSTRVMQVSSTLRYSYSASAPVGSKVLPGSITINGVQVVPAQDYRLTVNNFMADGGDGLSVLKQGRNRVVGIADVDALDAYFKGYTSASKLAVPSIGRITRLP